MTNNGNCCIINIGICLEGHFDEGGFLLLFPETFPRIPVTSVEIWDKRADLLEDVSVGGVSRLTVCRADIGSHPPGDKVADVLTMPEVPERIFDVDAAVSAACRMAKHFVVVTVPSKEGDNPEHVHLLTKDRLTRNFHACGVTKLTFDGVPGHLFMIARIQE